MRCLLLIATPDVIEALTTCVSHTGADQISLLLADFLREIVIDNRRLCDLLFPYHA